MHRTVAQLSRRYLDAKAATREIEAISGKE
jgi:hypothetical protein